VGFYELGAKAVTNPAYWWKDRVVDLVSRRKKPVAHSMWLMSAVDTCGHATGLLLFHWTLALVGRSDVVAAVRQPPSYAAKDLFIVEAIFVEAVVTAVTQIAGPLLRAVGVEGRLNNLVASFVGVRIMIWGMPYTGAMMNPASSLALTLHWARHTSPIPPWPLVVVLVVHIGGPLLGAIAAGLIEGRLTARAQTVKSA